MGYIISHMADHLGRTPESDLVYYAWKLLYVFVLTKAEYVEWRKNKMAFTIEEEQILRNKGYSELNIEELKTSNCTYSSSTIRRKLQNNN